MSQTQTVTHAWRPGVNDTFDDDDEDNLLYITANHGPSDTETVVEVEDVGSDESADQKAEQSNGQSKSCLFKYFLKISS